MLAELIQSMSAKMPALPPIPPTPVSMASPQKKIPSSNQTVLYFQNEKDIWEVLIFGVDEPNAASLEAMRTKIFKSIKINN